MAAQWRTATHWYRPIRLTDERRFYADMQKGWRAVGALPRLSSPYEEVLVDWYQPQIERALTHRSGLLEMFLR